MKKVIIEWQNQFGGWYRFQEQHHEQVLIEELPNKEQNVQAKGIV